MDDADEMRFGSSANLPSSSSSKKKVFPGALELHPVEKALILHYKTKTLIKSSSSLGDSVYDEKETKDCTKLIKVKSLDEETNITLLANSIIEKTKFLSPTRLSELVTILYELQSRTLAPDSDKAWLKKQYDALKAPQPQPNTIEPPPSVGLDAVDGYIEDLYEDLARKVSATKSILDLARLPSLHTPLITNESLMSALSRVLREDGKRSMDLTHNLIAIFYCFSLFSGHHGFITLHKLGDMCLRVLDFEITRFDLLKADLAAVEAKAAASKNDKSIQSALVLETSKFHATVKKQDQLIYVCLHLLLNLAEDLSLEVKMVKRDIVKYCVGLLDRKSSDLVHLALLFLKKLAVFQENKQILILAGEDLVNVLVGLATTSEIQAIQSLSLRLLLNLSHDSTFRTHLLASTSFSNHLLDVLARKSFHTIHLQLLYQLTLDSQARRDVFWTPIFKMILEYKGERVNVEVVAIGINLTTSPTVCQTLSSDGGLKFLIKRAMKSRDALLFKMVRNVSASGDMDVKYKFLDIIDDLMALLCSNEVEDDVVVELLGILANLVIPDFDYCKLANTYDLWSVLARLMTRTIQTQSDGESLLQISDDVLLECIMVLSTLGNDEAVAPVILKTVLLDLVVEAMIVKDDDDSILLQACYCIYQYLQYHSSCQALIKIPHLVDHLIDLLYDDNPEIRHVCDASIEIISQIDGDWELRLKRQKFAWHNSEWIKSITLEGGDVDTSGLDDRTDTSATNSRI